MTNCNGSCKGRRLKDEIEDQPVVVDRITEVAKDGHRIRFVALIVVDDKKDHVGFGTGKAQEVPEAVRKAVEADKKNTISVPAVGTTIPHEAIGHFGSGSILLKPAEAGSGVVAGGTVHIVTDMAGIADITSKPFGSNTPISAVRATIDGSKKFKTRKDVLKLHESVKSSQD